MEDRPMADVAVTARITYPNGTDASHCFVFSDPLLQGIDDVRGAGGGSSASYARGTLPQLPAPRSFTPSIPPPFLPPLPNTPQHSHSNHCPLTPSIPPPFLSSLPNAPQVEAPVPVTLAALFHNSGHGTAAAVATQSLLPTAATTTTTAGAPAAADVGATTTTGDTSSAAMSFSITSTALGNEPQPASFSVKVGSIPPAATAMVRWTIEASLTGTFDTVTTTNTSSTTSSPLTGLSPILESVDIHNLVHIVYLPDAASDDGLPDFLVDDDGDEKPEAIYSSAGNHVLPVTAVPSAALTPGRPLFTSETRAKLTVAVDWSALAPAAAGGSCPRPVNRHRSCFLPSYFC
ncbi:unnamed protein product [Closterium sp. NIES-54]